MQKKRRNQMLSVGLIKLAKAEDNKIFAPQTSFNVRYANITFRLPKWSEQYNVAAASSPSK